MSSTPRSLLLDLLSRPDVRAANRDVAILILNERLERVLYANAEGASLFGGFGAGAVLPSPAARQIRSSARALAAKGEARVSLRPPSGRSANPVTADLRRVSGEDGDAVLMTLPGAGGVRAIEPAWLLADLDLTDCAAAVFGPEGVRAKTAAFPEGDAEAEFRHAVQTLLDADETRRSMTVETGRGELFRVGDDLVVVRVDPELRAEAAPGETATPQQERPGETPADPPHETPPVERSAAPHPMSIASIVGRWHGRQDEPAQAAGMDPDPALESPSDDTDAASVHDAAATPRAVRTPFRSHWGTPASPADAAVPTTSASQDAAPGAERASAAPSDDPDNLDAPQPPERISTITPPDVRDDEAFEFDEPISVDAEHPAEESPIASEPMTDRQSEPSETPAADDGFPTTVDGGDAADAVAGVPPFVAAFDRPPVRFVWQIDRDGCFRSFSPEFPAVVGPRSADVAGRRFRDVAQVFGFDTDGAIQRLLDRRDTWSGRTILWPVEGSDRRVPIDLAALPIYARDRSFDGFRGFGIVRVADAHVDPSAIGLALAEPANAPSLDAPATPAAEAQPVTDAADEAAPTTSARPFFKTYEADLPGVSFGRRQQPPHASETETTGMPKVIKLEERRRPREGLLSEAEEAAFHEIGVKLGKPAEARMPGAPRVENSDAEPGDPSGTFGAPVPSDEATVERTDEVLPPSDEDARPPVALGAADDAVALPAAPDVEAGDATRGEGTAIPVAEATAPEAESDGEVDSASTRLDFDAIFDMLPLPVLVQARDAITHANREFLRASGYESLAALNEAGGLDTLFVERPEQSGTGEMTIRQADGGGWDARVHMQRISFEGRSALLMTFSPVAETETVAGPGPAEPPAQAPSDFRHEIEELHAVLDIATDGVVLVDPFSNIRSVNGSAQALFGLGAEDVHGQPLTVLFAHESQKAVRDYLEAMKDKGLAGILNDGREVIGRVTKGGFIPLFITVGRLSDERGWCVVMRDIARWKRVEEDLVKARREAEAASLHKSRFLANISHELRTPLNAIIGFADVIASECFGPIGNERYIEYLSDIKRSGHHVLDLVNDLLDISKIEAGKMELTFEAVSLNEVLGEVVAVMQPQANRERVIVRSNLPPSVPPVVADRRTIRQIALNLLSNSVRFTPAGGQIIASTTYTPEGDVLLRVRDSGIGMTEREIEIALTPFQQVHQPGTSRGDGTGLGLPLTKAMAEANRASFVIRSTPGEGTLVEIIFPSPRVLAD